MDEKKKHEILVQLQDIYYMNMKQSEETLSGNVKFFYMGKAAGIQECIARIINDDEFSASILNKWDNIYKTLEALEELDKKWKGMQSD